MTSLNESILSSRTRNFLSLAQTAAGNSTYRWRHGAVIVAGGRVRGVGWSKRKNRPANVSDEHVRFCSVHAEMDALRGIHHLRRATCYVARVDAKGNTALARPCNICWEKLLQSGVTRVCYTFDHDKAVMERMGAYNVSGQEGAMIIPFPTNWRPGSDVEGRNVELLQHRPKEEDVMRHPSAMTFITQSEETAAACEVPSSQGGQGV